MRLEAVGPDMRGAFRINELDIHLNLVTDSPHATFDDIAHTQFTPDLPHANRPSLKREGSAVGDHQASGYPRKISCQIVGDRVGQISCSGSFERLSNGRTTIERRGTGDNRRGLGFLAHLADEANAFARFERVAAPQFAMLGVERMIPKTELQARTPRAPIAPALLAKLGKSKGYLKEKSGFPQSLRRQSGAYSVEPLRRSRSGPETVNGRNTQCVWRDVPVTPLSTGHTRHRPPFVSCCDPLHICRLEIELG